MREETKEKEKITPEIREYQKRISDMLTSVIKRAEEDPIGAFTDLKSQIDAHPELSEYMTERDKIAWVMLLYTIDKFSSPKRIGDILSSAGINIGQDDLKKELSNIEAISIKHIIQEELDRIMLMSKLKDMMSGQRVKGLDMDSLLNMMSPGGGKGNPPS